MLQWIRGIAGQGLFLLLAGVGLIYMQQDSLIYHPQQYTRPLDTGAMLPSFELRELPFWTQDGNQSVVLLRPNKGTVRRIYLAFGGNGMVARHWISVLSHLLGSNMATTDIAFALVDYPGYGSSAGSPNPSSVMRSGTHALSAAIEALGGQKRNFTVGAIGHSLGCAAAMHFAAASKDSETPLRHLAISAPFTTLPEMAQTMLPVLQIVPVWLIGLLTRRQAWDNLVAAEQLASGGNSRLPRVNIVHGTIDSIVPHVMGQQLSTRLQALGFPVDFRSMRGFDHNDLLGSQPYTDWLRDAL